MIKVTFWSDTCAEGCSTYEELLAHAEREGGRNATTLFVDGQREIDNIIEVATQETYSKFFYHIHKRDNLWTRMINKCSMTTGDRNE